MTDLGAQRRFFAEEILIASNLQSPALVQALSIIARERFLPPGPWTIRGEADFQSAPRQTPDADPRHVYHNIAVAIDPSRMLFNGAPGLLAMAIDTLALRPGDRVLHVGTALGYYTALMAHCVGATGRVLGLEVDEHLAAEARTRLASHPWVEVRQGDGTAPFSAGPPPRGVCAAGCHETFDAVLVNAGVTHPLPAWLDALAPDGRMILPITATMPHMSSIGKGPLVLMTNSGTEKWPARVAGFVAIYTAVGVRDETINITLGQTLAKTPFAPIKSMRRDAHEQGPTCWLHAPGFCLSLAAA
jgi:protein-L-isoaspartate(D-aspartate) O-methyltransferase